MNFTRSHFLHNLIKFYILEIPSAGKLKYFPGIDGKSLKSISENLMDDGRWNKIRSVCGPGGCEYSKE